MRPARWRYTIPLRLRSILRRTRVEAELDEELRYHVERQVEAHVARGLSRAAARSAGRCARGGTGSGTRGSRAARAVTWLEDLVHDLRYGLRMLRRDPRFAAIAIVSLGLAIGLNTSIFGVVQLLMLD